MTDQKIQRDCERILEAFATGLDAMTPERWGQIAADPSDDAEWLAPEFAAAREACADYSWDVRLSLMAFAIVDHAERHRPEITH